MIDVYSSFCKSLLLTAILICFSNAVWCFSFYIKFIFNCRDSLNKFIRAVHVKKKGLLAVYTQSHWNVITLFAQCMIYLSFYNNYSFYNLKNLVFLFYFVLAQRKDEDSYLCDETQSVITESTDSGVRMYLVCTSDIIFRRNYVC